MFQKQDWAYFVFGAALIAFSATATWKEKSVSWLFAILGFILAARPMIQRREVSRSDDNGLRIRFDRPKIDDVISMLKAHAGAKNEADRKALEEATRELKELKSGSLATQAFAFVGVIAILLFGVGYSSSRTSEEDPNVQLP